MVLSKESWHFWLYKLLFSDNPTNFCPYFWGVVLSAILVLPLFILAIPWFIYSIIADEDIDEKLPQCGLLGIVIWMLVATVSGMFGMFFTKNPSVQGIGAFGWGICLLLLIITIHSYAKNRNVFKNSFLGNYVKAKKNKYCPIIEWKEKDEPKFTSSTED